VINHGDFILVEQGHDEGRIGQVVAVSDLYVTVRLDKIKTYSMNMVKKIRIDDIIRILNERGIPCNHS
jgi:ribosomal protein L24